MSTYTASQANKEHSALIPFDKALSKIKAACSPNQEIETIPLANALNRILARTIIAPFDVPGYDNSSMDGFVFRSQDLMQYKMLKLVGHCYAGHPYADKIKQGECVRIMTGAPIPEGCDTVEMQENTRVLPKGNDEFVSFTQPIVNGQHIRYAGDDLQKTSEVLTAGHRLKASDIGLIASLGIEKVAVYQPLTIAVLSTGDELRVPGQKLDAGCIYDSNRFVVIAMLEKLGFLVLDLGIIPDNPDTLTQVFSQIADKAQVVISSGGVSVGEADYTKTVLEQLGEVDFWKVAIKPGKPFAFGQLNHLPTNIYKQTVKFMGLPGNPVSAVVTLHQLAIPALRKLAGEVLIDTPTLPIKLGETFSKKVGRMEFVRAKLQEHPTEGIQVVSSGSQGSGMLSSISNSDGFIILSAEQTIVAKGSLVNYLPFDSVLN
ncbi:UNVERIFIED_CONTAM: hypothetical protein GTU68_052099 [Idotea baltica]|nr:hypothetical protein [Idotea baltica]